MPKEIECVICNKQVTKRKSLAYENGRACRDHKEVLGMVADQIKEDDWKKIDEKMNLICAVSMVRVMHSVRNVPVSMLMNQISIKKGREFTRKVEEEIERQGGPKLSVTDMMTSMLSYSHLWVKSKMR